MDGQLVAAAAKVYLMLNKPRGTVTTASDEKGRQTVYAFLNTRCPGSAPVGRLDKASEGLLLLTNDSEWAAQVTLADVASGQDLPRTNRPGSPTHRCWNRSAKE